MGVKGEGIGCESEKGGGKSKAGEEKALASSGEGAKASKTWEKV